MVIRNIFNEFSLEGKTAVITGGAGILGSAIAEGMGLAGARIAIGDIAVENTKKVINNLIEIGIDAKGYYFDVMDLEKIQSRKEAILKDFQKVDILVNAVGGNKPYATTSKDLSFFDIPVDDLEKIVDLNLFGGAIIPSQVFGREMVNSDEGGSIINISSLTAIRPLTRIPGYTAAKGAVSNFTQWLAVHFAQEYNKKVRVNALAPGFFLTHQNRFLLTEENGELTSRGKAIIDHTPMGRFGDPKDLIGVCLWLASDASRFVTGIVVPVDGGFSAFSGV